MTQFHLKSRRKASSSIKNVSPWVLIGDSFTAYKEIPDNYGLLELNCNDQILQLDPVSILNDLFETRFLMKIARLTKKAVGEVRHAQALNV